MSERGQDQGQDVLAGLSDAQLQALNANGFVVVPDTAPQIFSIYQQAAKRDWSLFVTTDAVLHAYHVLFDYALRETESAYLIPALGKLVKGMVPASQEQLRAATGDVQAAARANVAFFAVAQGLLDPSAAAPAEVQDVVAAELHLINAHAGVEKSPLFGDAEDYTQYAPRGHYTRTEDFGRYFRAMMWLGRMGFRLRPGDTPEAIARGRRQTRQAILIILALKSTRLDGEPAWAVWQRIYQPTAFFVGRTDDLSVEDYRPLVEKTYGPDPRPGDLQEAGRLDQFIAAALAVHPPRIVSAPATDRENPAVTTAGLRFMGQRFVFDSYVFQQLVFNQVKDYIGSGQPFTLVQSQGGPIRAFPRGLDIAAVFGSARAADILRREGDADYQGYSEQVAKLQKEVQGLPEAQWTENLYWSWLFSLRPLLQPKGKTSPTFMQSPAWIDKSLHTFLGSWAELRHDTLLYAKQSSTMMATSAPRAPRPVGSYVEPEIEVYARLSALTKQTVSGLEANRVLSNEMKDRLQKMGSLLDALRGMSERELQGQPLTKADNDQIRGIGTFLEKLTTFSQVTEKAITSETDKNMAIVADVHTDLNSGQALEEAVGAAFRIIVLAPIGDQPTPAVGGVFSYYEFKQPLAQRLTDEAWQALPTLPARPSWTRSFIVE